MSGFMVKCLRCGHEGEPADFIQVEAWISPESAEDGDAEADAIVVCPACTNREEVDAP